MANDPVPDRYKTHESSDPFPEIPPALLNSADIEDYANAVGLLEPFNPKYLKSASYEVPFAGDVHIWDTNDRKRRVSSIAKEGDTFKLERNSIAYVYPSTKIYLPDYIALRFNLRITHVHRGLLLGTGPLVDPGFCGQLLIPLHNLTSNEYVLKFGEGLIWIEFTKLSPNKRWAPGTLVSDTQTGTYVPFPPDKRFLKPERYFEKANRGNPIISSIPEATSKAENAATQATKYADASRKLAEKAAKRARNTLIASIVGLAVAVATIIIGGYQLTVGTNATVQDSVNYIKNSADSMTNRVEVLEKGNAAVQKSINSAKSEADSLANRLDALEKQIRGAKKSTSGR